MKRREFLRHSIATATIAGLGYAAQTSSAASKAAPGGKQEYYELRAYRLKAGANQDLLDKYLAQAAIPALNRLGAKPVGVFTEVQPKGNPTVFVLIPYASLDVLARVTSRLSADAQYRIAGNDYLQSPKSNPAFERIDSWLMLAFAGMPQIELPSYSKEKKPRMFEIRTYESHSELKALKKVEMFNSGEIQLMRDVGLAPVFYGQALIGPSLPHLTYMLSAENKEAHDQHWKAFGSSPIWTKMKDDPQYADTVSKITNWFVAPTAYSQI